MLRKKTSLDILKEILQIVVCILRAVKGVFTLHISEKNTVSIYIYICTGYTQKNVAVSKVNKKFLSHLTRAQRSPSAAATVQVSHALPAVRFSYILRGQFLRWRRSSKRLFVCSVLSCPEL